VLVGGSDLLDGNQLSVTWTAIAHAGGMGFCRLTPTDSEGATPIRRPRTVIVTDDGLGFAVAECDVIDGHGGVPPEAHQARFGTGRYERAFPACSGGHTNATGLGRDLLSLIRDHEIVSTGAAPRLASCVGGLAGDGGGEYAPAPGAMWQNRVWCRSPER
jgi:hypothetical protein